MSDLTDPTVPSDLTIPMTDAHVHLWNLDHPELVWDWVDTDRDHPILGDIGPVKMRAFELKHLRQEARLANVSGFIHVQAAIGSADPVAETRWLSEMAAATPGLLGAVAHVDLGERTAAEVLDRHAEYPLLRGVRDFAIEPYLASGDLDATMEGGLAELAARSLVLDADCEHPNMAALRALAERHPDLTVVLEHIGFPRSRDPDYFTAWCDALTDLAAAPNVVCKVSGVAMTDPRFTFSSLEPWVLHCLEAFGAARCLVGSNWPLDRLCSSYDVIARFYRWVVRDLGTEEQRAFLGGNAARVYRLDGHQPTSLA